MNVVLSFLTLHYQVISVQNDLITDELIADKILRYILVLRFFDSYALNLQLVIEIYLNLFSNLFKLIHYIYLCIIVIYMCYI